MKAKYHCCLVTIFAGIITFLGTSSSCAQGSDSMKVTIPFDSLTIDNIKATGNLKTGTLEIRMTFHDNYTATAGVSLSHGGFEEFGLTDEKGKKYKIYLNSHLIGTDNTNKGYQKIPFVQFGDKKYDWVVVIQQDLSHGQQKPLIVKINHFNPDNKAIKEFHISCILALNLENVGQELYKVTNLPIEWK